MTGTPFTFASDTIAAAFILSGGATTRIQSPFVRLPELASAEDQRCPGHCCSLQLRQVAVWELNSATVACLCIPASRGSGFRQEYANLFTSFAIDCSSSRRSSTTGTTCIGAAASCKQQGKDENACHHGKHSSSLTK